MERYGYFLLFVIVLAISFCNQNQISGTTDETLTGISKIYMPDGITPASFAQVSIYRSGDSSKVPIHYDTANIKGEYSIADIILNSGYYNVWAQLVDTLVAIQDSVFISPNKNFIRDDTLGKPGNISGFAALQPNETPTSIVIQALGTHIFSNVDSLGRFTLTGMAAGRYTLKAATSLPDYTPVYRSVNAFNDSTLVLPDTLCPIFNGIPVVTGMSVSHDTLHGVVKFQWHASSYPNLQDYMVYRARISDINFPDTAWGCTPDAVFYDTVFRDTGVGQFAFTDTNDYHYKYKVCIRNNSEQMGLTYKYVDVIAVSPTKVHSVLKHGVIQIKKDLDTDSASVNDTLEIISTFCNKTRPYRSITWAIDSTNQVVKTTLLDTTTVCGSDTLFCAWQSEGNHTVYIFLEDKNGSIWRDSVCITIVVDVPTVDAGKDTTITKGNALVLNGYAFDTFDSIVTYEWGIKSKHITLDYKQTTSNDTTILLEIDDDIIAYFRVTDEDGNQSTDSMNIHVRPLSVTPAIDSVFCFEAHLRWPMSTASDFKSYQIFKSTADQCALAMQPDTVLYNKSDTTVLITKLLDSTSYCFDVRVCDNTNLLSKSRAVYTTTVSAFVPKKELIKKQLNGTLGVLNNKLYVGGGEAVNDTLFLNDFIEYNPETNSWSTKEPMLSKRYGSAFCAFNNKLYAIGGFDTSNIYYATNIAEEYNPSINKWTRKTSMHKERANAATCVFNEKIYVFGGIHKNVPTIHVEEYDPTNDTWSIKNNFPEYGMWGVAATVKDDKIYLFAGKGSEKCVFEYNPYTDTWETKIQEVDSGNPHWLVRVGSIGKRIFAVYMNTNNDYNFHIREYLPNVNGWYVKTKIRKSNCSYLGNYNVCTVNNRMYIFIAMTNSELYELLLEK